MEELTEIPQLAVKLWGRTLVFNTETICMTWIVITCLILFGYLATRSLRLLPNPFQIVAELVVGGFYGLTREALDDRLAEKYFPLICTLFMFLLLSNWLGIIPGLSEPTRDLNTSLGLGLMGFLVAHHAGIRAKGLKGYLREYFQPIFFMAPLNIIGELAKVISISFRLFGNMMGGSIIILVVSHLIYSVALPPFMFLFFSLFIGAVQAFVFTMLTLVYISVQVK
jgi:F-type H+-transporting ATPase subunit a